MKKSLLKNLRTAVAVTATLAMAVAFMPANVADSYAAGFSTSGSVSDLKVTSIQNTSLGLDWSDYADATGYQVYRATSKNGSYSRIFSTHNSSCSNTGLVTYQPYYYKVRAYYKNPDKSVSYSKFSSIVGETPRSFNTANSVGGLSISSYNEKWVRLKWNSFDMATGYEVYQAESKNGTYKKIKTQTGKVCDVTGLTTKKTYYFKVRAYYKNSSGTNTYSKYSSVLAATPMKFTEGTVGGFKFSARTHDSVTFVWNSYPKATGYEVYRSFTKNGEYTKLKTTTKTYIKRTGLTPNKTCYYKVRAYKTDSKGKKVYTKFTAAKAGTPRLNMSSSSVISMSDGIKTTWSKVAGASGYEVYRATSSNGSYSCVKTTTGTSYKDTSPTANKSYYYKVRAYVKVDGSKKYSSFSKTQMGVKAVLSKVSNVKAQSTNTCVALSWKAVSGASGYEIHRATGENSSSNYTNVGSSSSTSFNDSNVANGLTYYYKIRAYRSINGVKVYGDFSKVGFSRSAVVSTAVAWLGCKESNKSNKPIIDLYNSNMGTNFSYTTPWCAIFVSAVAIKSGTTSIIVRGSYCPSVIDAYKKSKTNKYSYGAGSSYVPKAGDVIFFDWNRNGVPDHTGLVASVSGSTIKTIEGNYSDAVGYRTFSVGYKYVQGYGLPNYDDANGIVYTGSSSSSVGCGELYAMGIGTEPEGLSDLGSEYDFVEQNVEDSIGDAESVSDYDKMVYMVSKVRASAETEGIDCTETQYYAAFIYKLCEEEGLDASIMTVEDEDGTVSAWVEVSLDDKWYTVDASEETDQITEFVPESTDVEGATAE